jgi:6-bladed beta-propeller protein
MGRVVRLQGGDYAIADWDGQAILVFDRRGRFLRRLGRNGAGPGEYRAPVLVQKLPGDSLLIWDPYLRRLSWLDTGTGGSRFLELDVRKAYGSGPVVGLIGDGQLLIRHEQYVGTTSTGARQLTARLYVMDPKGLEVATVAAALPAHTEDAHGYRFFSPYLRVATDGQRIYAGYSATWEIRVYEPDGHQIATLIRPWTPRQATVADRNMVRAAFPRGSDAPASIPDDRFDPTIPAFGRILLSEDQSVWVLGYAPPYLYADSVAYFSAQGQFIASLPLPARFSPSEVGSNYILGTGMKDQDDFEVRVYQLTCSDSTSK